MNLTYFKAEWNLIIQQFRLAWYTAFYSSEWISASGKL